MIKRLENSADGITTFTATKVAVTKFLNVNNLLWAQKAEAGSSSKETKELKFMRPMEMNVQDTYENFSYARVQKI